MRIYRLKETEQKTGLRKPKIYALIEEGRFPRPVKIGPRMKGWIDEELDEFIEGLRAERDRENAAA